MSATRKKEEQRSPRERELLRRLAAAEVALAAHGLYERRKPRAGRRAA